LLENLRIEMLTQLLKVLEPKDKEFIKTNIFMKSIFSQNLYLEELFMKGTNRKFQEDMKIIIDAIQTMNGKIVA
jgi:hypothetical protein